MLIDRTYFQGDIDIANANAGGSTNPVPASVDWFIARYEPEFLTRALGLALYQALIAGYSQPTPDQNWVDLVQGKDYTDSCGNTVRWRGLITSAFSALNAFDVLGRRHIIVDRAQDEYDPAAGQTTTVIPPEFVGQDFIFRQRGFDDLIEDVEYSVSGNVLTLLDGKVFGSLDVYWYKMASLAIEPTTGTLKQSPIAYYIYYWFQRDLYTQSSTMSEVKSRTENAVLADPFQKMATAWNRMVEWVKELDEFLQHNTDVYPEWKQQDRHKMCKYFGRINEHGF